MAKQENELAKLSDLSVPSVLEKLQEELKQIKSVSGSNYQTSGVIPGGIDIKKEKSIENMIRALANINISKAAYDQAAEDLKLDSYPVYQVGGYSVENWKHDIDLRIKIITHEDRKKELEGAISKMEAFLSEEDRKSQVLKEIAGILK